MSSWGLVLLFVVSKKDRLCDFTRHTREGSLPVHPPTPIPRRQGGEVSVQDTSVLPSGFPHFPNPRSPDVGSTLGTRSGERASHSDPILGSRDPCVAHYGVQGSQRANRGVQRRQDPWRRSTHFTLSQLLLLQSRPTTVTEREDTGDVTPTTREELKYGTFNR